MRKLAAAIALACSAFTLSSTASAATYIINPVNTPSQGYTFGVACPGGCSFTDFIQFLAPAGFNSVGADIITTFSNTVGTNIDFGSAPGSLTLNGVDLLQGSVGTSDFGNISNVALLTGGTYNVLKVSGFSAGDATYSGNIVFSAAAVPEPSSWALMILGIGFAGLALRRRKAAYPARIALG